MDEPEQHNPSDLQRLPSAVPVSHPSGVPKPALLVHLDVARLVANTTG